MPGTGTNVFEGESGGTEMTGGPSSRKFAEQLKKETVYQGNQGINEQTLIGTGPR